MKRTSSSSSRQSQQSQQSSKPYQPHPISSYIGNDRVGKDYSGRIIAILILVSALIALIIYLLYKYDPTLFPVQADFGNQEHKREYLF
jgi:hypothetical protein